MPEQTETSQEDVAEPMPRREFLRLGSMSLVAATTLVGCGIGGSSSGHSTTNTSKSITVMTNPADPMLAKISPADGSSITLYGSRDSSGNPTALERIIINKGNDTSRYTFNAAGFPTDMSAPDGTRLQFDWKSATQAAVTISTSDGKNQINALINKTTKSVTQSKPAFSLRQGKKVTLSFQPFTAKKQSAVQKQTHRAVTSGTCTVTVTQCGSMPDDDADVWVRVMSNGELRGEFPAVNAGNGQFNATIPTKLAATFNPGPLLHQIAELIDPACEWTEGYREALPVIIRATILANAIPIAGEALDAIVAIITSLMAGLETYCTTVGYSAGTGGDSILKMLSEKGAFLNQDFNFPMGITAYVVALPEDVFSQALPAPSDGPFPSLSINLGGQTTIRGLTLNPDAPTDGAGYVGTADIYCLPSGTTITLSVVGTDGYTNSQDYSVPTEQSSGTFTLTVPGASSGVHDTVTVRVKPPTGNAITLTASLIFG